MSPSNSKNRLMLGGNIFGYFTDLSQTSAILDQARDLGIYAIDTADVYSNGVSEEFIGECLKKDRSRWFLATKAGNVSHGSPKGLGKKEALFRKVEASLKRLQTDYLDLYQIHHFDPETPLEETVSAFQELLRSGKVRAAGISNYTPSQLETLQTHAPHHCFQFHQAPLNIVSAVKGKALASLCESRGMKTIAYGALARGIFHQKYLTGTIPEGSRAAISSSVKQDLSPEFLEKLKKTDLLGQQYSSSLVSIALNWLKSATPVEWTIVGCRGPQQLKGCFEAWSSPVVFELLQKVEEIWK